MLIVLRFFEELFYGIGSWFEDWADSIDEEFHKVLIDALAEDFKPLEETFAINEANNINNHLGED